MELVTDLEDGDFFPPQFTGELRVRAPSEDVTALLVDNLLPRHWVDEWCKNQGVYALELLQQGQLVGAALFRIVRGRKEVIWEEEAIRGLEPAEGGRFDATGLLLLDVLGLAVVQPYKRGRGQLLRHGLEHILRAQPRENADRVWLFARASTMKKSGESAADWWQHEFDKPPAACAFLNAGAFGSQLAAVLAKAVQPHVKDTTSSEIAGLACDLTDGSSLLEEAIAKSRSKRRRSSAAASSERPSAHHPFLPRRAVAPESTALVHTATAKPPAAPPAAHSPQAKSTALLVPTAALVPSAALVAPNTEASYDFADAAEPTEEPLALAGPVNAGRVLAPARQAPCAPRAAAGQEDGEGWGMVREEATRLIKCQQAPSTLLVRGDVQEHMYEVEASDRVLKDPCDGPSALPPQPVPSHSTVTCALATSALAASALAASLSLPLLSLPLLLLTMPRIPQPLSGAPLRRRGERGAAQIRGARHADEAISRVQ